MNNDEIEIFSLCYECPHRDRDADCPLAMIDVITDLREKFDFVKELSDTDKNFILKSHKKCSKDREQ